MTDNLDLWTSALLVKSTAGRGSNGRLEAYGIKRLRALILELAMRGKLVTKEAKEEPANAILERIKKEKARLVKEGTIKNEKPLPDISDAEKLCELPKGWSWVRFGSIAQHNSGKTLDSGRNAGELRDYITTSNLYWGRFELSSVRQMPIADNELKRCTARKGDLLICEGGESGRAAVWPYEREVCFQNHVHRARFFGGIDPYFVYRFFEKLNATGEIDQYRKGVGISNMSSKALASIVMPLPPLALQHRIVAKVEELMALCDQLERQQGRGIEAHQTLIETLLGTLTNVASAQEFTVAWSRIAEHFDTLFTTEHSIDQLKQAILQLAIMGKLVLQNSSDEPASELCKRIAVEMTRLVEGGGFRRKKSLPDIREGETPYELPDRWEWVRLGQIISISSGDALTSANMNRNGEVPVYGGNGVNGYHDKANVKKSTLVIGRVGYYCGSIYITPASAWVTDNAFVTTFSEKNIDLGFLYWLLKGTNLKENENATAQPVISGRKVYPIVVGLPPKKEQLRIVAKVDELMALCDALKARLAEAQTTQIHLADAIVERAVAAPELSAA